MHDEFRTQTARASVPSTTDVETPLQIRAPNIVGMRKRDPDYAKRPCCSLFGSAAREKRNDCPSSFIPSRRAICSNHRDLKL